MKHLKMLGLAAITALGLMAFVGAGTASATTLFTDSAKTIKYSSGTAISISLRSEVRWIDTSGSTIAACTTGGGEGKTSNETGTTVSGNIASLTWGGCTTTTDTIKNGSLSIAWTSGSSGTVTGSGTEVTKSIFGVSCTYGTGSGTHLGTITGGTSPVIAVNATVSKTAGGFLCPGSLVWIVEWVITSPHAFFVGS